ncbi:MAG: amidohydrolase [Anaerolineales bacterium]
MNKLLYNARIHTLDEENPISTAVLIKDGRFSIVGNSEELFNAFSGIPKQDMEGRVILPGLTDAHIHLQHFALGLQMVDCETSTRQECLQRITEKAQQLEPGEWILGHGWNHNHWQEGYGNAASLDEAAPHNPVYLTAKSLHAGWANSQALAIAGVTSTSDDPHNGHIIRNAAGDPSGILLETAMELVNTIIPEPSIEKLAESLKFAQSELWKLGLTGIHDFDRSACFSALQLLHQQGELKLRVLKSIPNDDLASAIALGLRTGFGDDLLWMGSVKLFADGALGPRTAAMLEAYEEFPGETGQLSLDEEQVFEIGVQAVQNGISLAIHAIGDRANKQVLNGYARLRKYEQQHLLPHARHRIEHVQLLAQEDIRRLADLDLIASMQPIHQPSDMEMADRYWGDRCQYAYAPRTQLKAGAVVAFGSDAPVESPNPFLGIHAAVTRRNGDGSPGVDGWYPEQRLSAREALIGFTQGPAYAAGRENRLGKIKKGFLADLVVLEHDPFDIDPSQLKDVVVQSTMVAGDWVYMT